MANNKYQKLIRQYSDDGVTWYDLQPIVYRVGELLEEDSYCQARIYREITGDTSSVFDCDENGNKYEMILFQYSDNNGTTWVTYDQQRGNRLENLSEDCGVEYRWIKVLPIESDYICEGTNKYYRIQGEYTVNGTDWYTVNQYKRGDLYESNSEDCGYSPDSSGGTTGGTSSNTLAFEFSGSSDGYSVGYWINGTRYTATTSPFSTTLDELGIDEWTSAYRMFRGDENKLVTQITSIPDTSKVTDMYWMFQGCSGLKSINLSNFNTSNVTNMYGMFQSCGSLTSLDVSNFNTSNVTNMGWMFYDCNDLTSLDVSNFNTSKVTDMGYMFWRCSGLTSLDVSNFDTSKVTDMNNMFFHCSAVASLDVSNFDTSNVTNMERMFAFCNALTSIDLSNFNTSKVTNMYDMFGGCSGLTSLDVSNFDTSNVTDMGSMFDICSGLTSLDVSNFNTSNVTEMDWMFGNCDSLTSLDVSNFDTSNVTNMSYMFHSCNNLTSIDLSNFDTSKVTKMTYMFNGCEKLTSITMCNCSSDTIADIETALTEVGIRNQVTIITDCGGSDNPDSSGKTTGYTVMNDTYEYICVPSGETIVDSFGTETTSTGNVYSKVYYYEENADGTNRVFYPDKWKYGKVYQYSTSAVTTCEFDSQTNGNTTKVVRTYKTYYDHNEDAYKVMDCIDPVVERYEKSTDCGYNLIT